MGRGLVVTSMVNRQCGLRHCNYTEEVIQIQSA